MCVRLLKVGPNFKNFKAVSKIFAISAFSYNNNRRFYCLSDGELDNRPLFTGTKSLIFLKMSCSCLSSMFNNFCKYGTEMD